MARRCLPSQDRIYEYWSTQETFDVPSEKACFACDFELVERCHLQDHSLGGDEGVENLVLLCRNCHGLMPFFDDREEAVKWVQAMQSCRGSRSNPSLRAIAMTEHLGLEWYIKRCKLSPQAERDIRKIWSTPELLEKFKQISESMGYW